jgi:hypothetical protein
VKTENERVDAYILANLPASFQTLWTRAESAGEDWYRPIDRRLQALRKRGLIRFERNAGKIVWFVAESGK